MVWSSRDPGAGDPGSIRHQAQVRTILAESISQTSVVAVQSVVTAQGTAEWTGLGATAFFETAAGFLPEIAVIISGLENDAAALYAYATEVEAIKNDAFALTSTESNVTSDLYRWNQKLSSLESLAFSSIDPADKAENLQEQQRYEGLIQGANWTIRDIGRQWDELASRRTSADSACIARLTSGSSRGGLSTASDSVGLSGKALLDYLAGLSATELAILLAQHPELADQIASIDPATVSQWWASFDDPQQPGVVTATQQSLISGIPFVIGNLNGVPLARRVDANKLNIAAARDELADQLAVEVAAQDPDDARIIELQGQISVYYGLLNDTMTFYDGENVEVTITGHNIIYFDADADAIAEYSGLFDPITGGVPSTVHSLGLYIPGMKSTLESFGDEVERSEAFVNEYKASVAMITWKGGTFATESNMAWGPDAAALGSKLEIFSHSLYGMPPNVDLVGMGYSYGGAVLGNAEAAGLDLARSIQISGAGMGYNVTSLADYPNSSNAPHYSFMAPEDYTVGLSVGLNAGDLGHGASPVEMPGVIRLETGWLDIDNQSLGQVTGHEAIWDGKSTAHRQMERVLTGGKVELYAEPEYIITYAGPPVATNPILDPDYKPVWQDVPGGSP